MLVYQRVPRNETNWGFCISGVSMIYGDNLVTICAAGDAAFHTAKWAF